MSRFCTLRDRDPASTLERFVPRGLGDEVVMILEQIYWVLV